MINGVFVQAFSLLAREGLEAILVLTALAIYLERAGASRQLPTLWLGAGSAVLSSLLLAWALATFTTASHNDLIEGITIFIAAGLMIYVSGWLMLRQDPRAWQHYLRQQADRALSGGTVLAVGALAFTAVMREGAETVLFLHTLASTSGGWTLSLIGGLAAASAALALLFVLIHHFSLRLPLRPVFILTSAFLFLMALKLIGDGLQEFQEMAWIESDPSPFVSQLSALGLNGSWQALVTQGAVCVAALATYLVVLMRERRAAEPVPAAE